MRKPYDELQQQNVIDRLISVAGKQFSRVSNPNITSRESIAIGDYIVSLKQQLQASQEECAALKVQVNELRNYIEFEVDYQNYDKFNEIMNKTKEQSFVTHINEVIERCAKIAESYEPDEKLKDIAYASRDIRNLKTEGE